MKKNRLMLVILITQSLAFFPVLSVHAAENLALPSSDLVAPVIEHTPISDGVGVGNKLTIEVKVTDNVGVKRVTLYYRHKGDYKFKSVRMSAEMGTVNYVTTLLEISTSGYEYYIQAADHAGNTVLHGHNFSPLLVGVSSSAAAQKVNPVADIIPAKEKSKISKWVWVGVGVLAVGAIAASGGGGGSSAGGAEPTGTVVLTASAP